MSLAKLPVNGTVDGLMGQLVGVANGRFHVFTLC
jgi:hypothetical protein